MGNKLVLVLIVGLVLGLSCCKAKTPEDEEIEKIRTIVAKALKQIDYPSGSRILFLRVKLDTGVIIKTWIDSEPKYPPVVLREPGYFVFIDEAPDYDWEHPAKWVFVPEGNPSNPRILFTGGLFNVGIFDKADQRIELNINSPYIRF